MKGKKGKTVFRFAHFSMGTTFELLIGGEDENYARQVSQAVFAEVDRIENLFSRFDPSSEIGQINRLQPGRSLRIGMETYECLNTALWVQSQTGGAFDVNLGGLVDLRDKDKPGEKTSFDRTQPSADVLNRLELYRIRGGYAVKLGLAKGEKDTGTLILDLGGIGKGYALDRTLDVLSDWGIERALIHGGTSTAVAKGTPAEGPGRKKGWPVGVGGDWKCPMVPRKFFLKDRALSGSGTEVKGAHIVDPRTGKPARGHLAAWVSHPSATVADALSTAFMVMNTDEVSAFCAKHLQVWALLVTGPQKCRIFNRGDAP
jgi:thiamine biosynthesis lipoprotein